MRATSSWPAPSWCWPQSTDSGEVLHLEVGWTDARAAETHRGSGRDVRERSGHRRRVDAVRAPAADGKEGAGVERHYGFVRREKLWRGRTP
jgi:hypothetical protein